MNYKEARVYLDKIAKYGSVLGLENIRALLSELHNPQDGLKFIHIAGTNGKGSTLAFISTILSCAGYQVGRYISPTIYSYRERIQVGEEPISKEALALGMTRIQEATEALRERRKAAPTVFEVETALAFWYFKRQACDIVILETGLGGNLDATNIIARTEAAVFASISRDHMAFLGDTTKEIAKNKVGIIKKGASVVTTVQEPEAGSVLFEAAKKKGCPLRVADYRTAHIEHMEFGQTRFSYDGFKHLAISLSGGWQVENAVLAIETIKALKIRGWHIEEEHIRAGLLRTSWDGRLSAIGKNPLFVVDGAHNVGAVRKLREAVRTYFEGRRLILIAGVFADKEYPEMMELMAPLAYEMFTVHTPDNERALPAGQLKEEAEKYCPKVTAAASPKAAAAGALKAAGPKDVILAFGSLSYLGELTKAVRQLQDEGMTKRFGTYKGEKND